MKPFANAHNGTLRSFRLKASIKKVPIFSESAWNRQRLMISAQDFCYFLHMYILLVCFGCSLRLIFAVRIFFFLALLSLHAVDFLPGELIMDIRKSIQTERESQNMFNMAHVYIAL